MSRYLCGLIEVWALLSPGAARGCCAGTHRLRSVGVILRRWVFGPSP